jgi:[ribosomal protein S18]-alanine N-acetyltransferase
MVAEIPKADTVVGFMIYELHKTKLHILNFAVGSKWQGRGVGRQMIEKMIGKLSSQRRVRLTLEIRETNVDAQCFFRAMGFRCTNVMAEFYDDSDEDAYLFEYRIRQPALNTKE